MLTGTTHNQVDQVWEMFWASGVANPISVIEQISANIKTVKYQNELAFKRKHKIVQN